MLSYCLKCIKNMFIIYQQQVMAKQYYYQNALFVGVENQKSLKIRRQKVY